MVPETNSPLSAFLIKTLTNSRGCFVASSFAMPERAASLFCEYAEQYPIIRATERCKNFFFRLFLKRMLFCLLEKDE